MVLRLLEGSTWFLRPLPYSNMEGRKTTRFFKKSSYYITEACTPQKTTSNFVFLKSSSTTWTTSLKGLKTTANCSFFKKSLYSLTATSSGVFSIPDSKRFLISLILLTATSDAEKRQRRENVFSNRPSISLLLNSHMRGPENDMFFSKPSLFPNFMCRRAWKKRLPLFRSRRSFCVFTFYFISRSSSSLTSSVGLSAASSLFRKASIAFLSSRRSSAQSSKIRSLFFRPNMATPQQ